MRIILLGPTHPFRGGISHYTTLLYRNLKKNHQVRFFSFRRQYPQWLFPGSSDKDSSEQPLKESGVHYTIDSLNPLTWFMTVKAIVGFKPDLVIIPWWTAFWTLPFFTMTKMVKTLKACKILFLCHNVKEHESTYFSQICTRWVLGLGDYFLVHSKAEGTLLGGILPRARIIHGFHPTYEDLQVVTCTKNEARRQLEIDGNVLLFFGFIRPYKGLNYLLKAMPEIAKQLAGNITLMIVGECWQDEQRYVQQIRTLGIGKYVKRINRYVPNEDVGKYFAAADLIVIPYVSATGSGILQAAFGAGRPVIATRIGALTEAVQHGKTGYLVAPADTEELIRAVVSFFREGNGYSFQKNIANEKDRFSWERLLEIIETSVADDMLKPLRKK